MEWLEPEVHTLKRNLTSGAMYEDMDSFTIDLDKLKARLLD
jgi:hypothetical protein